jgi:2,4-dienoyl-CoA reductase-like NADH-dependent reductase (Old Yellow Enzyme family)
MTMLNEIEHFMKIRKVPPTRFGREALNDPRLVFDLRRGREMGKRTRGRIEAYLKGAVQ